MLGTTFNLQGHRGARGLKPGNTLPSFEVAMDAGATSIETDLHLTHDGEVMVCHDPTLAERVSGNSASEPGSDHTCRRLVSSLLRSELKGYVADLDTERARFPYQDSVATPLAVAFARQHLRSEPFVLPTLDDMVKFVVAYAGEAGKAAGKSDHQRERATRIIFDLELKRVSGRPERIGDKFDGRIPGLFEDKLLECIHRHGVLDRTVVRSFDHRSVRVLKEREPRLRVGVIIANSAPIAPEDLVRRAGADLYCPDVNFLDELQVRQLHAAGIPVVPWTVNDPADWERLLTWGVDGITTDYPHRLAELLRERGVAF